MAGGGSRKDDSVVLNSTNVFAALGSLRKKKKPAVSEKDRLGTSKSKSFNKDKEPEKEPVFWAPAPLSGKSWADVDDEDDDDYYATTAPPVSAWSAPAEDSRPGKEAVEESESEEEGLDEVDDDVEEEHENEHEHDSVSATEVEPVAKKPVEAQLANKDMDRQLSKKELKKKGLEELDAVLAELGYAKPESTGQEDSHGVTLEKKLDKNGEVEKKENAPAESKSGKKKKKKEKSVKETKESQDQCHADAGNGTDDVAEGNKAEDASAADVKERLKKLASAKKKKSSKEMDAAARAATSEAAARSARLAAAKKKEKNHYNQQPVR